MRREPTTVRARCRSSCAQRAISSLLLGDVLGRCRAARAEQKVLALLLEHLVRFLRGQVEAVLVDEALGVLDPVLPGLRGNVVVDPLAERVLERLVGQTWKVLVVLRALDHAAHGRRHTMKMGT